ncbi:fibronectin type III domain-containing protein [Aquimarina mytili]|uniref:Fibronectin type-III domain-containing protein n=1 Tax=Aquimarina mytili TaxID=874423 RepID=A0A937D5F7_9FLAO|nr:hypothetical protein [Aquimarina mytili]MBL0683259.1 hypothetical protein [Aquimarina mytili]
MHFQVFGQSSDDEIKNEVRVVARVQKGKVLLRWAVSTSSAWLKANKHGYKIDRYTVSRDGQLLSPPVKTTLTSVPLLPYPVAQWEEAVNTNDYAAILAQALYGEGFQVEQMEGGLAQIINKSREIEQRFSFGLYAADMNFEAAKMGGLGFEDTNIVSGEEYLYSVETLVPVDLLKIEPGSVSVKVKDPEPLPVPLDLYAVPNDKNILLTWEYEMFKGIFTSYYLERSENGNDFQRLGDTPLVNLNDRPGSPAKRMFYVDTLSQNNKTYYYRVKGISPFGEISPPSEVVSGQGIKKLSAVPHISRHTFDASGGVNIQWDFPKETENEITGFELDWAAQEKGPYKTVKTGISKSSRNTTYSEPEPSNYFRVTALGKNNQKTTSLTAFVQTIDSIPPAAPVGVVGIVDSLGVVKLNWTANTEKDFLGYRVFRGNLEKEELSQITISPVGENTFQDTIQVKSLNSKVFYQVVAVDKRFNMSDYSEKLALKKPDVVPPSSPVFKEYKVQRKGVFIEWINSTSDDVVSHKLYRQNVKMSEQGWQSIFVTDTVTSYTDSSVEAATKYRYAIFAEDDSGLQSAPSTPITITSQKSTDAELIKGFSLVADRVNKNISISWRKMPKEVIEIIIYKSKKEGKPVLFKQMPNTINRIVDSSISPGNTYVYSLKAITKNGNHSKVETKEVIF